MIEMCMSCEIFLPDLQEILETDLSVLRQFFYESPAIERWGGGTVEPAVAQLLYVISRRVEPQVVVEFGTNVGYSTFFLAKALLDNHDGVLYTFEIDLGHIEEAKNRTGTVLDLITFCSRSSTEADTVFVHDNVQPELAFIDSSHQYAQTKRELSILREFMPSGFILFHDALAPESEVTKVLDELIADGCQILRLATQPNTGFGVLKIDESFSRSQVF